MNFKYHDIYNITHNYSKHYINSKPLQKLFYIKNYLEKNIISAFYNFIVFSLINFILVVTFDLICVAHFDLINLFGLVY